MERGQPPRGDQSDECGNGAQRKRLRERLPERGSPLVLVPSANGRASSKSLPFHTDSRVANESESRSTEEAHRGSDPNTCRGGAPTTARCTCCRLGSGCSLGSSSSVQATPRLSTGQRSRQRGSPQTRKDEDRRGNYDYPHAHEAKCHQTFLPRLTAAARRCNWRHSCRTEDRRQ